MSRWRPSTWNRAVAKSAQRDVKIIERMRFETPFAYIKAEEIIVCGKRTYDIAAGRIDEKGSYYDTTHVTFENKDEANAMWKTLRRNYFVNDAFC